MPLILAFIFFSKILLEHNSKEAFYNIEKRADKVYVLAEFPWTIRKALLDFDPELREAHCKEAFEKSLFNYVETNFKLITQEGEVLQLYSVKEVAHVGHNHQSNFEFYFYGTNFVKLKNELFFNITPKHKNHHRISLHYQTYQRSTTIAAPFFLLIKKIILSDN